MMMQSLSHALTRCLLMLVSMPSGQTYYPLNVYSYLMILNMPGLCVLFYKVPGLFSAWL